MAATSTLLGDAGGTSVSQAVEQLGKLPLREQDAGVQVFRSSPIT